MTTLVQMCSHVVSYKDSCQCIWPHIHGLCFYDQEAIDRTPKKHVLWPVQLL